MMLICFILFLKACFNICLNCISGVLTLLSTLAPRLIHHIANLLSLFGNFRLVAFSRDFHNAWGMRLLVWFALSTCRAPLISNITGPSKVSNWWARINRVGMSLLIYLRWLPRRIKLLHLNPFFLVVTCDYRRVRKLKMIWHQAWQSFIGKELVLQFPLNGGGRWFFIVLV